MAVPDYTQAEARFPKDAVTLISRLRAEIVKLQQQQAGPAAAYVVQVDQDWFVMKGPDADRPPIRLWLLGRGGPQLIGMLEAGKSLMFQTGAADLTE